MLNYKILTVISIDIEQNRFIRNSSYEDVYWKCVMIYSELHWI
jgi:hypothetical protein